MITNRIFSVLFLMIFYLGLAAQTPGPGKDQLYLTDGSTLEGLFVERNSENGITFITADGIRKVLPPESWERLWLAPTPDPQPNTWDRVVLMNGLEMDGLIKGITVDSCNLLHGNFEVSHYLIKI